MRFDLTVPLARFVASNPALPKPFRRYAVGKVWRYDNPQAKRWREFWQADIDIVGSSSPLADAECAACMCEVMQRLGFADFVVRVNSRVVLESMISKAGVEKGKIAAALRIIDKLDKIGESGVRKELRDSGINAEKVMKIIKIRGKGALEKIEKLRPDGIKEVREFMAFCKAFGVQDRIEIDASLARGLEYYTRLVFEISLPEQKVSFAAGGRYDNLIKTFGGGELPSTGLSLGVDRILSEMGSVKKTRKIFIATIGDVQEYAILFSQELRRSGVQCEMDVTGRGLSKQLSYASSKESDFVVIIGQKEARLKKAKLRDMETGEEKLLSTKDIIKILKK